MRRLRNRLRKDVKMALKLKYTDEHGILHIDMSPTHSVTDKLTDPKFDSINKRFGQYDILGGKYDGGETSLFRSRYNSFEEELANTPYAFTERRTNEPILDITIDAFESKDLEDNRFFEKDDLFGPKIDLKKDSFTVTQLIHAQDRYYDLSKSKGVVKSIANSFEVKSAPISAKRVTKSDEAFKVLSANSGKSVRAGIKSPTISTSKKKRETSFAIIAEPTTSCPTSPRSLPVEIRPGRVSPFKGRGFREETSRHNTPKTSAANSRSNSPPYKRTSSLSRIDTMAQAVALPPPGPIHRPPRDFLKENMEEIRELSELNREKNEAEAEKKKRDEEIALLKEMGILDKKGELKSTVNSRTNSRSSSPSKVNFRSRSNSPSAILRSMPGSSIHLNKDDGGSKPVAHRSRLRSVSKSQPESNNVSPKHSKIPKRQSSVSPTRANSRQSLERNLSRNQRYMSNSTSSIHETIRIGSQVHDKRASQSTQHLNVPAHIKGKPPISPGRTGPPPSNKFINPKRLSPIVGTPNKSPVEDPKIGSTKTSTKPTTVTRKTPKTTGSTPATSRLNSRPPSRAASRDPSPEKRKPVAKTTTKPVNGVSRTTARTPTTKTTQKPPVSNKTEPKKPVSRTNSVKNLSRTPSSKTLNEKPPLNRQISKKDLSEKSKSTSKLNEVAAKKTNIEKNIAKKENIVKNSNADKKNGKEDENKVDANVGDEIVKQDNETQYDKAKNESGDLVILTKKNVVSMTTAAITSQPLEVVATVTNQLPSTFEKAKEKGIFERLSSDSLLDEKESKPVEEEKKPVKPKHHERTIFTEDHVRLRLLQPPYNNPQVEKVKQKIDSILKEPEISTENICTAAKAKEVTKAIAEKAKSDAKEAAIEATNKAKEKKDEIIKEGEEMSSKIRSEATKIVDSIMTPIEEPKEIQKPKIDKKIIEPIVTVVSEKTIAAKSDIEKVNETLVQGGPEVEVQSSNLSTPGVEKANLLSASTKGSASDKSHSNGGFPQSASTTPKPPPRTNRDQKSKSQSPPVTSETEKAPPKPNICSRLMDKCKTKCCSCCIKSQEEERETSKEPEQSTEDQIQTESTEKQKFWKNMNCFKKKVPEEDVEIAAGKGTTIEFETETKRKRKLRDVLCAYCRRRKVSDIEPPHHVETSAPVMTEDVVKETGCCGKKKEIERRDSILSDQAPSTCCNNRFGRWIRGACRRQSEQSSSRRTSLFSKNKSLSPTLPPEDTRKKLDPSLIEHTSVMRGAIPVLPAALAYFCLLCNIVVPGLGTIFSGMFCLCFGIPRFGVHDGAKHRIGSFIINLLVGCGQLFTVLFCLVGWGWSIWWGVIMVKTSRKFYKLKAEAAAEEAEAPPVTSNNHTRA